MLLCNYFLLLYRKYNYICVEIRLKYKAIELVVETKYLCGKLFFNICI